MLDSFFADLSVPTSIIVMAAISAVVNTIGWIILLIIANKKMKTNIKFRLFNF